MKNSIFLVFFAVTALLQGCANQPMNGTVLGPVGQPAQEVPPGQFLCPETGRWQVGPCGRGTQVPVGSIVQGAGGVLGGIGKCELAGGAVGAAGGAVIGGKDHRGLGAIIGAVVGAFAGNKYCESDAPQQVATQQQRRCASGKVLAKLNWKGENGQQDHPQHGTMVCMDPNDPHKGS